MTDAARIVWAPAPAAALGGAWWPRTPDAASELTTLLPCAATHLGHEVTRVSLNMGDWSDEQPRRLHVGDRLLRLGWFHTIDPATVSVAAGGQRTTLLVIPSDTDPDTAGRLLAALAATDPWPETVAEALAVSTVPDRGAA